MPKAQASSEYVILVGFLLGITIPLLIVYFMFADTVNNEIVSSQLNQVTNAIADSADKLYFLGEPSQTTLKVYIPQHVSQAIISNKAIIYRIKTKEGVSDIIHVSASNLTGSLPTTAGVYEITLKAEGGNVVISYK